MRIDPGVPVKVLDLDTPGCQIVPEAMDKQAGKRRIRSLRQRAGSLIRPSGRVLLPPLALNEAKADHRRARRCNSKTLTGARPLGAGKAYRFRSFLGHRAVVAQWLRESAA